MSLDPWHFEANPVGAEMIPILPPATGRGWLVSASGAGERELEWPVEDGDFSLAIMNADGSPGVAIDIRLGVRFPYLRPLGWAGIGVGAFFALAGVALVVFALRRGSDPAPHHGPGPRAPVAAP